MKIGNRLRRTAIVVAFMLVSACATGPDIRRDINPTAAIATYKTFAYFSPLVESAATAQAPLI